MAFELEQGRRVRLLEALVRVVAREWVGYPAGEVYQQLEKQGWVWTGGGWYPRVDVKSKEKG